jgi:hypothetical protein
MSYSNFKNEVENSQNFPSDSSLPFPLNILRPTHDPIPTNQFSPYGPSETEKH